MPKVPPKEVEAAIIEEKEVAAMVDAKDEGHPPVLPPVNIKPPFEPKDTIVVHWKKLTSHEQYAVKALFRYMDDSKRTIK